MSKYEVTKLEFIGTIKAEINHAIETVSLHNDIMYGKEHASNGILQAGLGFLYDAKEKLDRLEEDEL